MPEEQEKKMRKNPYLALASVIVAALAAQSAAAQIRIDIPRIPGLPKLEKPKREQPRPEPPKGTEPPKEGREGATEGRPASATGVASSPTAVSDAGQDQPTVAKDSVQMTPFTVTVYRKNFDVWSWVPRLEFRVNGPIPSGSQLYAEFTIPGTGPWVKFDCRTEEKQKGYSWKTSCGARDIPEDKASTYTGPVSFAIKMRNELAGTDSVLFTGKVKVEKVLSSGHGPKAANHFVYFVNHDWNLPVGYVYLTADDLKGWESPDFYVSFWVRGDAYRFQPHLFLNGKEVGKTSFEGREVGQAGCESDVDNHPSQSVAEAVPQKARWSRVRCSFPNVVGWDKTGADYSLFGPPHSLGANPGEYELKVLWNNKLARSIKFSVAADGKFDNGLASSNKLGSDKVIVPVQIIGDQDGQWNRTAWKTDAFYGNPLTGFMAMP